MDQLLPLDRRFRQLLSGFVVFAGVAALVGALAAAVLGGRGLVPSRHQKESRFYDQTGAEKSAGSAAYPPLTPMNCRFFLVEGDPGSPSAFRFMMDLREEAGKDGTDQAEAPAGPRRVFFLLLPVVAPSCSCAASAASSSFERNTPA